MLVGIGAGSGVSESDLDFINRLCSCPQVYVPPHPLVKHWLAVARNAGTPNAMFRAACAELGRILIYEAVREFLPTIDAVIETPMGPSEVTFVDPTKPVKVGCH
jgi:uracil phosphoribosyltransferase